MRIFILSLLFLFVVGCASTETKTSETIRWYKLKEGIALARKFHRPCVIDFYFPGGCSRCSRLEQRVYNDPRIIKKINSEFIPIRINLAEPLTSEERALGERFKYKHECLLVFMDEEGRVIEDLSGNKLCFTDYIEPEWFLKYLEIARKRATNKD